MEWDMHKAINKLIFRDIIVQREFPRELTTSKFSTYPRVNTYNAVVGKKKYRIQCVTYGGLNNYLSNIPRAITYYTDQPEPTTKDFILRNIDNIVQKPFLEPLVQAIRSAAPIEADRVRIAISLVQNIPYRDDDSNKYPYEVLYTNSGNCEEKSELLAYLLRDLGYGVAIFDYDNPTFGHMAVGIKCTGRHDYIGSGYAFVETTKPRAIADSNGEYTDFNGNIIGLPIMPDIIQICNGKLFDDFDNVSKCNMYLYLKSLIINNIRRC